ncbi:MAG: hypothetical protein LBB41_00910 [Prevotellaceae bacterium]|jgi:hypothetical protein|nr:hypothetical protein [Prevotellaceae bacterium]
MRTTFIHADTGLELHLESQSDSEKTFMSELACFGVPKSNQKLKVLRVIKNGRLSKIVIKKQTFITEGELNYLGFFKIDCVFIKNIIKGRKERQIILFCGTDIGATSPVFAWALKRPIEINNIIFGYNPAEKVINYGYGKTNSGSLYQCVAKRLMTTEQLKIFIKNIFQKK